MGENNTELIVYQTEDGKTKIDVYFGGNIAWLSKAQMAELFLRDRSVIFRHIRNVLTKESWMKKAMYKKCTLQIPISW